LEGHVEVHVEDDGPGMDEATQARLFEPFFTTKPPGDGTGLGLSLAYDIVTKSHGGTLTATSRLGEGTTFVVTLPVNAA
ncbi:MAG: HAMP domain-containing histidine kinase, partial [Rhodothermaceae bacterium]|nr:HAMP domain-containing histidine kinase [Rhodothermaceae bacterium]